MNASRLRSVFQLNAGLVMTVGLVLMGNPLFGPNLKISGYFVMLVGVGLLVVAVFLGAAGFGKGMLANRLSLLRSLNAVAGAALAVWAVTGGLTVGAEVFLAVLSVGLVALAVGQELSMRHPERGVKRLPSTQAQRQAALRGEQVPPKESPTSGV